MRTHDTRFAQAEANKYLLPFWGYTGRKRLDATDTMDNFSPAR